MSLPDLPHVEVYQRVDGLWDWRLIAVNGEQVCESSQGYTRKEDAVRGYLDAELLMRPDTEIRYAE